MTVCAGDTPFAQVLARLMAVTGVSGHALAQRIGVDPSYVTRMRQGDRRRQPSRAIVEILAPAICQTERDRWELLAAAGYLPVPWEPSLSDVAEALGRLDEQRGQAFRQAIHELCKLA